MKRDWSAAREKVEREGLCRVAFGYLRGNPCEGKLEASHVIGREHDKNEPFRVSPDYKAWKQLTVAPDRIVPLCRKHHTMYDGKALDLLGYLTKEEEAQAVLDAESLETARRRLCPSEYKKGSRCPSSMTMS